ncbi:hypothetical protein B0H13DRAFT_1857523 [Mycena leptocephala]|nr:hypothetical protein B0H13DRAFT_1857523 [Mycena leptocephala]
MAEDHAANLPKSKKRKRMTHEKDGLDDDDVAVDSDLDKEPKRRRRATPTKGTDPLEATTNDEKAKKSKIDEIAAKMRSSPKVWEKLEKRFRNGNQGYLLEDPEALRAWVWQDMLQHRFFRIEDVCVPNEDVHIVLLLFSWHCGWVRSGPNTEDLGRRRALQDHRKMLQYEFTVSKVGKVMYQISLLEEEKYCGTANSSAVTARGIW